MRSDCQTSGKVPFTAPPHNTTHPSPGTDRAIPAGRPPNPPFTRRPHTRRPSCGGVVAPDNRHIMITR
jgi:hypothetical protein